MSKAMAGDGKKALVPRLRFPEFRDTAEWRGKPLGKLVAFSSGGTPSKENVSYWGGSIPWISASSMHDTNIAVSDLNVTESAIGNGTRIATTGNLLVLVRGSMLFKRVPIGIATRDVAFNQDVKSLSPCKEVDNHFLLYYLITVGPRIPIHKTGIGAGKIETSILASIVVAVPELGEQQKIADCLSSLDALIEAHTDKLAALKTHKQGLLQQLFPRDGETVPRLRFPEFRDAPAWEPEPLGKLCKRITNGKANAQDHEDGGRYPLFDRSEVVKRSNAFSFDAEAVIVPGEGMRLTPRYFKGKFNLHQRAYALMEHQGDARFVFYALDHFNGELVRNAVQSTVPSLRLPIIEGFVIPAPTRCEQQKIADFLSSIDTLITVQANKIEALKKHKQGLLQQLFPAMDEVAA